MISPEQFHQHATDRHGSGLHTRVPVVREVLSDLDTPLSVYLKLADAPHTYLLESVEGGERFGRYSIIGLPAIGRTVTCPACSRTRISGEEPTTCVDVHPAAI